ncbi:MATE family efflux transporter [Primorskyibacter sp. S87]|uniref:MATE family efflux transporter n=1 Tax=Primorskyibacter sp. S87 TaxID=3415126 RepID=UPI003C7A5DA7
MTNKQTELSGRLSLGGVKRETRDLARLGFPIVISLAAATMIGVVDTVMVAPLGTLPLAAVSITTSVLIIFYSALYGFVSVIGVRMARAFGEGSGDALSVATWAGVAVSVGLGLLGTAAMLALKPALGWIGQPPEVVDLIGGYWTAMSLLLVPFTVFYALKALFDAIDRPWLGVGLAFLAVGLNIPANFVLIHGLGDWPGFGLLGAGLASLLSEVVSLIGAVAILILMRRNGSGVMLALPRWGEVRIQLKEGSVISFGYVAEGAAYSVAGLMMGWFSAEALAAHRIVSAASDVLYMVPMGVSIAVSIRVAQTIGGDEREKLTEIGLASLLVIVSWMSLVVVMILVGREPVSASLSSDPKVVSLAVSMFLVIAAMQIADGIQGTMLGASRGMMDNRVPVVITLVAYWVVALPIGYALGFNFGFGPNGIWIGYGIGLAMAAAALTYRFFGKARV